MKPLYSRVFIVLSVFMLLLTSCTKEIGMPESASLDEAGLYSAPPGEGKGTVTVSGGGTALEGDEKSTFTLNAVMKKDGSVSGMLIYHIRVYNISVRVNINCLSINGNIATMSGPISKLFGAEAATAGFAEGNSTIFTVVDNGEGNAASPDMFSDLYIETGGGTFNCLTQSATPYIPLSGNFSIK